jgi:Fimbrial protein.
LLNNTDTGAGAATKVSLQLLDGSNSNAPIKAGDPAQIASTTMVNIDTTDSNTTVTNLPYSVQYYSATGGATAGTVASQVTYSIQYN